MTINERIDQIAATLAELRDSAAGQLRDGAAGGRRSRQLIDSLFRTVHSLKAVAAAEGLSNVSRTAHELENVLHSLRTGKIALDADVLRAFDETVVALREGSATSGLNVEQHNVSRDSAELPPEFVNLKDNERHRALAAIREGANLYVINVEFEVSDFDKRFRRLKEQLEKDGEPISTSASMNDDAITFKVVYASRSEKIPVQNVLRQALRAGQTLAATLNKQIDFVVKPNELLLEKSVADALTDALLQLVRNAVEHGIESAGKVTLAAETSEAGTLHLSVTDNGRGIDAANLPLLFQPGFSTATEVSETSGRGVGLDAVKAAVEQVGGSVNVVSYPGEFTSFVITIPSSDA